MDKSDHSWIVIGPGRTGSKFIVDVISAAIRQTGIDATYIHPDRSVLPFPGVVQHSHNTNHLKLGHSHCVLSTRDCVDSALSWCIRPHVGIYHFYPNASHARTMKIKPFVLDEEIFLQHHKQIQQFYIDVEKYLPQNTIRIDYSQFQDSPRSIIDILKFDPSTPLHRAVKKNPTTHSDWILNWDEIDLVIKSLRSQHNFVNVGTPSSIDQYQQHLDDS